MPKAKQITAWVENKPGEIGRIAEALGKAKVNITAVSGSTRPAKAPFVLWLRARQRQRRRWRASASAAPRRRSCALRSPISPGVSARSERLGAANINVDYAYGSIAEGSKKADVVLAVSDLAGAAKACADCD